MRFEIIEKNQTSRGANYFKLKVEINNEWVECCYFGNTTPKQITSMTQDKNGYWKVEIQKHTCRDKYTGKFKSIRRK